MCSISETAHSQWQTNTKVPKAKLLALEWDGSVMLPTLQSSLWGQADARFQLKQQALSAVSFTLSYLEIEKAADLDLRRGGGWVDTSVVSDAVRSHRRQPTRLPSPWDSPGKNTGVGCHFLLQCMKVKSEVAQSCPTLRDPMGCSLPGSSVHGIFQARVLEWGAIAFSSV